MPPKDPHCPMCQKEFMHDDLWKLLCDEHRIEHFAYLVDTAYDRSRDEEMLKGQDK